MLKTLTMKLVWFFAVYKDNRHYTPELVCSTALCCGGEHVTRDSVLLAGLQPLGWGLSNYALLFSSACWESWTQARQAGLIILGTGDKAKTEISWRDEIWEQGISLGIGTGSKSGSFLGSKCTTRWSSKTQGLQPRDSKKAWGLPP